MTCVVRWWLIGMLMSVISSADAQAGTADLERACRMLSCELEECKALTENDLHALERVILKYHLYKMDTYNDAAVKGLVARMRADMHETINFLITKTAPLAVPVPSPWEQPYLKAVNTFLRLVGMYENLEKTKVLYGKYFVDATQQLFNFMQTADYQMRVASFLPQAPQFDFSVLPSVPATSPHETTPAPTPPVPKPQPTSVEPSLTVPGAVPAQSVDLAQLSGTLKTLQERFNTLKSIAHTYYL